MTNLLVGDVYAKIIEEVVGASANDFEESGVSSTTLQDLQQEWQAKLSQRGVAQMPWDPKPAPPPPAQAPNPPSGLPSAANGSQQSYQYNGQQQSNGVNGGPQVKAEPGTEQQWQQGMPNGYPQASAPPPQGGLARAQQLVQQYGGQTSNGSPNPMQQRGGLALPGQQPRPQGLQLPGQQQSMPPVQQQYSQQQQQQMLQQRQQLQQQQTAPNIKVENNIPATGYPQQSQPPQPPNPSYSQTDGADDAMEQWQTMLAQRRAAGAEIMQQADHMMRNQVMDASADLRSGLMVPLDEQPTRHNRRKARTMNGGADSAVPQLDGDVDDEDDKDVKDEDDENAINSDLDDSDDDGQGNMGDDDDDLGDSILCTYDKVQRVKNKWKCTLKDGVMSVGGKEYVFHKGTGEYEW